MGLMHNWLLRAIILTLIDESASKMRAISDQEFRKRLFQVWDDVVEPLDPYRRFSVPIW